MNPQANQKCLPFCPLDRGDQAGFILDLPSGFGYLRVKQRSAISFQLLARIFLVIFSHSSTDTHTVTIFPLGGV